MLPFLSLFLLLFAFFVVLSSLTRLESVRTRAALGSLEATFRGQTEGRTRTAGDPTGPLGTAARLQAEIGELLAVELPFAAVEIVRNGEVLEFSLSAGELFVLRRSELRADRAPFLDALTRLVLAGDVFAVSVRLDSAGLEAPTRRQGAQRAGALARALVARGLDEDRVTAGINEAPAGLVRLRFHFTSAAGAG